MRGFFPGAVCLTWRLKSVCSNRGPIIAFDRGCWPLAQIPVLFGACIAIVGWPVASVVSGTLSALGVVTALESNWRGVDVIERWETRSCCDSLWAARSRSADMILGSFVL